MSEALTRLKMRVNLGLALYLKQSAEQWRGDVTRRFGRNIKSRSGMLAGSMNYTLTGNDVSNFELRCYSAGVPYARAQEFGATIRAKNKYLTIPLSPMLTSQGVTRQPFRQWLDQAKTTGHVRWIRKGLGWVVAWAPNKTAEAELFWKLQPSVTLPGPRTDGSPSRLGFFDTWKANAGKRERLFKKLLGAEAIFGGKT